MPDRREEILSTAEDLLRRYGIAKTTVSDVARALGLSHAAVYKYFDTRAELQDAVARRWLHRITEPLLEVTTGTGTAEHRLRTWVKTLIQLKLKKVRDEAELFTAYQTLAESATRAVAEHLVELRRQLQVIVEDGQATGEFRVTNSGKAAAAILDSTVRFHHPHFVSQSAHFPEMQTEVDDVLNLMIAGLKAGL